MISIVRLHTIVYIYDSLIYVCLHIFVYKYINVYTCIHTYIHACMHACIHTYIPEAPDGWHLEVSLIGLPEWFEDVSRQFQDLSNFFHDICIYILLRSRGLAILQPAQEQLSGTPMYHDQLLAHTQDIS